MRLALDPSGRVLLHDDDLNDIPFHTRFFAFGRAKAVGLIKGVGGVIIFLNFQVDGAGGGKGGEAGL